MTTRRAFGEELRRHREQRGITLEQISSQTKIGVALLAGLERGDCSRWPPGIYSRAYIRDYAHAVSLDRDETAARFSECFTETAFPDGAPRPKQDPADGHPSIAQPAAPLRMMIADEPQEHRRAMARRAAAVALDVLFAIVLAAAMSFVIDAGFWMALGIVSLCCHGVGVVRGRAHVVDAFAALAMRRPNRRPDATRETVLAEAA